MKTTRLLLIFVLVLLGRTVLSQPSSLPRCELSMLDGSTIDARNISTNDLPLIMVFWNSEDRKSMELIRMINEEYNYSLEKTNVKIVGIYSDYSGTLESIRPLVNGIGLDFDVYIDRNNEFKRAMNVPELPYAILFDPNLNDYQYLGYCTDPANLFSVTINKNLAEVGKGRKP
jgi:cytochrome c biogenesis protein CcmG, thiol:disulfide interchange protein DsbE